MTHPVVHRIRWYRDLVRRRVAMLFWDRPSPTTGNYIDRVVFIRWDAKLGDTVVLSWVFRELKRQKPNLKISVITSPALESLFREGYGVDSVFLTGKQTGWRDLPKIAQVLRRSKYVVHLSEVWRPRDLNFVRKLDAENVVGLDDELKIINIKLGSRTQGSHFSDRLVPWLNEIGIDTNCRQYWVPINAYLNISEKNKNFHQDQIIGFCPYGASKKRHLSSAQIEYVINLILKFSNSKVKILVMPEQQKYIQDIYRDKPWFDKIIFPQSIGVLELFAEIEDCSKIISVDTAIVHIATGLQKPLLALYGDLNAETDNYKNWHPNSSNSNSCFVEMGADSFLGKQKSISDSIENLLKYPTSKN
jgi:ADP-heptose:LPS heptosyltransferase